MSLLEDLDKFILGRTKETLLQLTKDNNTFYNISPSRFLEGFFVPNNMAKERTVDLYILDQQENLKIIYAILNDIILEHDNEIKSSINYGLPFYKINNNKAVCYLTTHKKNSVDITFWNSIHILNEFPELDLRDRKRMASLNYTKPEDIDIELIHKILAVTIKQVKG
jgi:hypothetical protein